METNKNKEYIDITLSNYLNQNKYHQNFCR